MSAHRSPSIPSTPSSERDFQRHLDRHFAMCSAIAGAAAAICASPLGAQARVVYSGPKNVATPMDGSPLSIDLDTGAFSTTEDVAGFDLKFSSSQRTNGSSLTFQGGSDKTDVAIGTHTVTHSSSSSSSSSTTSYNTVGKLKAGKLIDGTSVLVPTGFLGRVTQPVTSSSSSSSSEPTNHGPHSYGPWGAGGTGYVGFRFVSAAGTTLYGWAQLAVSTDLQTTVVDWAYEDDGQPITAGAITDTSIRFKVVQSVATPGNPALVRIKRIGDLTGKLKVAFKIAGGSTAVDGRDFAHLTGKAVIPAGKKSVTLAVSSLGSESSTGPQSLALKFLKNQGYLITTKPTGVHLLVEP